MRNCDKLLEEYIILHKNWGYINMTFPILNPSGEQNKSFTNNSTGIYSIIEEEIIKVYIDVLKNNSGFPEDFFNNSNEGLERAGICFKYLCEVVMEIPEDLIPKEFLSINGVDILTTFKLNVLVPDVFRTIFDLLYTVYPDLLGPAYFMENVDLKDGWKVKERYVAPSRHHSGGYFSVGYLAEAANGSKGFLKAIDYNWAFKSSDPSRELQRATSAYNFERDVLEICKSARLNRVVKSITYGSYRLRGNVIPVDYLIFELADGDVRDYLDYSDKLNYNWAVRCLHHVSVGLNQLHSNGLAHQDLKPSNVLIFGGRDSKIGDLGRSVRRGVTSPHETYTIAGDQNYAPPELLYEEVSSDWSKYRIGCDAYMLGSLTMFIFSQIHMTAALKGHMNPEHWHDKWGGSFIEVLPYIREAFNIIMSKFEAALPTVLRSSIGPIVRELCEPDPVRRATLKGEPRTGSYYSLQRYVSKFNEIATKLDLGIWRID